MMHTILGALLAATTAVANVDLASSRSILAAGEEPKAPAAAPAQTAATHVFEKLTTERYPGKQDDLAFVDALHGFYVNGAGKIFETKDGGASWALKLEKKGTYFRCIAFLDAQRGFAGNIGKNYFPNVTDDTPLYRTRDGGATWEPAAISGPPITGLCALEVVRAPIVNAGVLEEKAILVGGGRVGGPAVFVRSDDDGETWKQVSLAKECGMVLDVHFFDRKHGLIAAASSTEVAESRARILRTEDGGDTWTSAWESSRPFELTWKLAFPTRDVGYCTIQSYDPSKESTKRYVAKTVDGGKTWSESLVVDDAKVREFGVAFVDEKLGWIGAMPGGFETRDGGATWTRCNLGNAVNKLRVVRSERETIVYGIGVDLWKLVLPR